MGPTLKDFGIGFCVALTLMIAADYIGVKRVKDKVQQKMACGKILEAADEYHSIYFLAPGMIMACQEVK